MVAVLPLAYAQAAVNAFNSAIWAEPSAAPVATVVKLLGNDAVCVVASTTAQPPWPWLKEPSQNNCIPSVNGSSCKSGLTLEFWSVVRQQSWEIPADNAKVAGLTDVHGLIVTSGRSSDASH